MAQRADAPSGMRPLRFASTLQGRLGRCGAEAPPPSSSSQPPAQEGAGAAPGSTGQAMGMQAVRSPAACQAKLKDSKMPDHYGAVAKAGVSPGQKGLQTYDARGMSRDGARLQRPAPPTPPSSKGADGGRTGMPLMAALQPQHAQLEPRSPSFASTLQLGPRGRPGAGGSAPPFTSMRSQPASAISGGTPSVCNRRHGKFWQGSPQRAPVAGAAAPSSPSAVTGPVLKRPKPTQQHRQQLPAVPGFSAAQRDKDRDAMRMQQHHHHLSTFPASSGLGHTGLEPQPTSALAGPASAYTRPTHIVPGAGAATSHDDHDNDDEDFADDAESRPKQHVTLLQLVSQLQRCACLRVHACSNGAA